MDVIIWLLAGVGLVGLVAVLRHRPHAALHLRPPTAQARWVARSRWDVDGED